MENIPGKGNRLGKCVSVQIQLETKFLESPLG